jgi:hypothetical protein
MQWKFRTPQVVSSETMPGFLTRCLATYLHSSHLTDRDIVARIQAMTERLVPETFVRQNNLERRDGADVHRSLTCPILILCGENNSVRFHAKIDKNHNRWVWLFRFNLPLLVAWREPWQNRRGCRSIPPV